MADMPVVAQPKAKSTNRRVSVSAESMDPNKLKAQMSQVTNIPKSPEVSTKGTCGHHHLPLPFSSIPPTLLHLSRWQRSC
ncbi:hypothetical protein EON65_17515 [archaeon]|nr:MAG: hypothetical protein EON65_17515 [archaeon]